MNARALMAAEFAPRIGCRVPRIPGEIRAFLNTRNEAQRLPQVLDWHRRLGVGRFIIADDGSSDGTLDLLAAQPDVHVFRPLRSLTESRGGAVWMNALLDRYGIGHWCLVLDADELTFYPGAETASLRRLTMALEAEGATAMHAMLLDMYAPGRLADIRWAPEQQPLPQAFPLFDPGPYWHARAPDACPPTEIYGGVRQRVFFPEWHERRLGLRIAEALFNLVNRSAAVQRLEWLQRLRRPRPPNLAKVPLVRWQEGFAYDVSTHRLSGHLPRLAAVQGVLLHFKFAENLLEKAQREVRRQQYFQGAREYQRYLARLEDEAALVLADGSSMRFEGSAQLVALGLMQDAPHWRCGEAVPMAPARKVANSGRVA
jgi:glycosyltransferase involved in cell wall biosynthesis